MLQKMGALLGVLMLLISLRTFAADFYIIDGTHKTQSEAQASAATHGGWVLITNFYKKLPPDSFAVVHGPYRSKKEAEHGLAVLKKNGSITKSYIKNAGEINLNAKTGNKDISPQIVAAILGEVQVQSNNEKGGSTSCEPQVPFRNISLIYFNVEKNEADSKKENLKPKKIALDIGSLTQVIDTGVIERNRGCAE
jgi:hypothetical protein